MWIVAVHAFNMTVIDHGGFRRVMVITVISYRVLSQFDEFRFNIKVGDIAVMAGDTVIFFSGIVKNTLITAGIVRCVAVFAGIAGDSRTIRIWPGIRDDTVPCARGSTVRSFIPEIFNMTGLAQG